jgi:hypothetical protein
VGVFVAVLAKVAVGVELAVWVAVDVGVTEERGVLVAAGELLGLEGLLLLPGQPASNRARDNKLMEPAAWTKPAVIVFGRQSKDMGYPFTFKKMGGF